MQSWANGIVADDEDEPKEDKLKEKQQSQQPQSKKKPSEKIFPLRPPIMKMNQNRAS